jgi:hypothetical protein
MAQRKKSALEPEPAPNTLPDYLGKPVTGTSIRVRGAGDGLSAGMAITPEILAADELGHLYVVLECEVGGHYHRVGKDDPETWTLEQVLNAGVAVVMDADVIREAIAAQAERLERASRLRKGVLKLPITDEDSLLAEHERGEHADGVREGCPECDEELRLEKEGK